MVKKICFVLCLIFLSAGLCNAGDGKILRFIYCSDVHYGLEREFRGDTVTADSVSRAMIQSFKILRDTALPDDMGVEAGRIFGDPEFIICTGDIANRMEDGVQSATESWNRFCSDWSPFLEDSAEIPLYMVPGNHDISNAIGYPKPLEPEKDAASAAGIYNLMMHPQTDIPDDEFDYSVHKTRYSFIRDSIMFAFIGMWPDSEMREWLDSQTAAYPDIPVLIFTHDPPEADAKHFTNPNGHHDINPVDKFQNLLTDTCSVRYVDRIPKKNWKTLEEFIYEHPSIKAYFHGDWNFNEFYTWNGVKGRISLPVFRVDSPMKGDFSSEDETLLSYIVVTIDLENHKLTARECLWNTRMAPGIEWGESRTICY